MSVLNLFCQGLFMPTNSTLYPPISADNHPISTGMVFFFNWRFPPAVALISYRLAFFYFRSANSKCSRLLLSIGNAILSIFPTTMTMIAGNRFRHDIKVVFDNSQMTMYFIFEIYFFHHGAAPEIDQHLRDESTLFRVFGSFAGKSLLSCPDKRNRNPTDQGVENHVHDRL